jgi:hypothetical protein
MRLLTLAIAIFALVGVAYVSFNTPSRAAVFGDDLKVASAAQAR